MEGGVSGRRAMPSAERVMPGLASATGAGAAIGVGPKAGRYGAGVPAAA